MGCKDRVPALAGEKHQAPMNSPADGHWSTGQWEMRLNPLTPEGREGPSPSAVNFGQNEGHLPVTHLLQESGPLHISYMSQRWWEAQLCGCEVLMGSE